MGRQCRCSGAATVDGLSGELYNQNSANLCRTISSIASTVFNLVHGRGGCMKWRGLIDAFREVLNATGHHLELIADRRFSGGMGQKLARRLQAAIGVTYFLDCSDVGFSWHLKVSQTSTTFSFAG